MLYFIQLAQEHEVYNLIIVRGEDLQVVILLLNIIPRLMLDTPAHTAVALKVIKAMLAFTKNPDFINASELSMFAQSLGDYEAPLRTIVSDIDEIKALKKSLKEALDEIKNGDWERKSMASPEKRY